MTVRHRAIRQGMAIVSLSWLGFATVPVVLFPAPAMAQADMAQTELTRKVRTRVAPTYPDLARRLNIHGTVKLVVVVAPSGDLKEAKVVGGNPILVNAAVDAVKKWKFEPAAEASTGTVEFKFQPAD